MPKALLINSSTGSKAGNRGRWLDFDQALPYIQGIETNIDAESDVEVINTLVSGVPTPWARARLFELAFKNINLEANIQKTGLIKFYEILVREWKGLLACLAIYPQRIRVSEPIELDYNDFSNGQFDIPSALGRMLFEDTDLWTDPAKTSKDPTAKPSIQLIYYNDQLVGAASPYSLLFTAAEYSGISQKDMPWYRDGSFEDPIIYLSNDQKQKLFLLINNIDNNIQAFEQQVNSNRGNKLPIDFNGFKEFIRNWGTEVRNSGRNISDEGTLDAPLNFAGIYKPLFNVRQSVYFDQQCNAFFHDGEGRKEVDPKTILLQEDFLLEFPQTDEYQPMKQAAVHFLEVLNDPNQEPQHLYFPIPLSEAGLLLFKNRVNDLLSNSSGFHRLYGELLDNKLKVSLELKISERTQKYSMEYDFRPVENARSVIMWPDFISDEWDTYYLYSEFPENDKSSTHFVPFFRQPVGQGTWDPLSKKEKDQLIYAFEQDHPDLSIFRLISFPSINLDSNHHKYDIIKSNLPIAGLEIRKNIEGKDKKLGYLVLKNSGQDASKIKDLSLKKDFGKVVVGFDFGSNNSCIQFADQEGSEVRPVPFKNRRVFLVGTEIANPYQVAHPNELYFFQNETPENGQIKSWVHEHNRNYIIEGMDREELAGGVAVFESNIHIKDMDEKVIITNAGRLHHSMKWLTEKGDNEKKIAYLKNVWVQTCADLYENGVKPIRLRWSYPGSFSAFDKGMHKLNYQSIISTCPIVKHEVMLEENALTESEAVSNYALTRVGLHKTNLFLGLDIGGSTSDVLLIAMDPNAKAYKLIKQSSVRLAAKYISDAIKDSKGFQEVLLKFHGSPNVKINIPNIKETIADKPHTAQFFLNAFFDRLKGNELREFYSYIASHNAQLFAIPAYMTGLLVFYSGQLVAKAYKDNTYLSGLKTVELFPFGKGGRVFDWLDVFPGRSATLEYFNDCFLGGFEEAPDNLRLIKNNEIRKDNKSEVAKGLVAPPRVVPVEGLRANSDIFGESGYTFEVDGKEVVVDKSANISTEHFRNLDHGLTFPEEFKELGRFIDIFLKFTKANGIIQNTSSLKEKQNQLHYKMKGFVTNDREYLKAHTIKGEDFEFKHSMLILEGMCFLEEFLIPEIYQNHRG